MSQPLSLYVDPVSDFRIQALDVSTAFGLVESLTCLVNLSPSFRTYALEKFADGQKDTYLVGSWPTDGDSSASCNGLMLYRCVCVLPSLVFRHAFHPFALSVQA